MINTDNLNSCIDLANGASADLHRTMLHTMQQMADRIEQLEARLDGLDGDRHDSEFERRVLSVIEDNSYTTFTHIEAELEEKLDALTQSYAFAEAVKEAVEGSIVQTVEEIIEERISADLLGADAEDVVRKGLRHLI